ncbi:MAG TPA: hypothetical protein ACFCUC_09235 [Desulfobacterales bacterium]
MDERQLLAGLSKFGFSLFETAEELDINQILAEVAKRSDKRLWEGFPVLLANASEKFQFTPEKVEKQLPGKKQKERFHRLILLSGAIFAVYHLSFSWWSKFKKDLSPKDKEMVETWKNHLVNNRPLELDDATLDPQRLKNVFELYFEKKAEKDRRRKEQHEELSLEYALSQVFSPKQKELFKKKLGGHPLTKTEQEYYSRTVKKKVVALANSDLHSLSKKLLGL